MADQGKGFDADGMEDLIQKMLEKYGESEEQTDSVETPRKTTSSQDATKRADATCTTKEADNTVNDMIRREAPRWDKAYGTEDNDIAASTSRESTSRREIGRRPTTSTEDTYTDHVEIGRVIRSQTGVAKQLISVTQGLDEVNDDLEEMKRELKRIQTKAHTCLDGGEILGGSFSGQTAPKEFASVGGIREVDAYRGRNEWTEEQYRGRNEWIEERQGVVRFDDGNSVRDTESYLKSYRVPVSHLPGAGRAHIKETDIHLTNLLTIADPVEPSWQTRSTVDNSAVRRERNLQVDRFGRPVAQYISIDESSSKRDDDHWRVKGSHNKSHRDGYCYLCEEFDDLRPDRKSMSSYTEAPKVDQRPQSHRYSPISVTDQHLNSYHRRPSREDLNSYHRRPSREDLGIYRTPSGIYFYSDDASFPNEVNTAADMVTRTTIRQSSVPRFFPSQTQPAASQRLPSQSSRQNTVFTSRFLDKVRRRNSIGGRIDTERYRGQTLKSY